jgi:hypothetical protein
MAIEIEGRNRLPKVREILDVIRHNAVSKKAFDAPGLTWIALDERVASI